jgi:uncharacterized protein
MTRRPAKPAATPATSSVIRPPMPLDELDRWLRTPRKRQPVADCLTMLDGFVTAIVAGPVTYEPFGWLCPLLGVTKDACLNGDTLEFAAIAAVAEHHNIISAVLSETQNAFMPLFGRSETGDVDVGPWCRGFYAAIQLNPKFWRKLLPARRQAHLWLIPILAHCTGPDGRPVPGAPPLGPFAERARFDAPRNIPPAVVAMREFWAPSRYNRAP